MPIDDWQFWVVSLAALGALAVLLRVLIPTTRSRGPACSGCATGAAACAKTNLAQKASLPS